jgi:hypothetical protein
MREHPRWPSSSCVVTHFGSWSAALAAAGLPARSLTFDSSVAERVEAAQRMARAGLALRAIARALDDRHDPWNAALAEAGAVARFRRWSDDAIRAALAGFWARTGRPPTAADLRDPTWEGPGASTLRRRYGGVAAAWRALGPVPRS